MGTPLTEEGLAKLLAKQSRQTSTGTGIGAVDLGVDTFKKAIDPFGTAIGAAGKGISALSEAVNGGLDTWRDLSKSGAGFNNDIVGMTVAAAGARLPLQDFAGVIKDNTDILGQLAGNVSRGGEAFAKMSKSFFESGATDSLKQLGYTNKDLNEILALQAITLRGKFRDDQHRDAVAIESATKLATEMDLMAKLTGKSREAQMDLMKKQQADMQFEAAIRLKTAGMGAEEAAKFEANARQQFKDAEIRGQGQMFKEVFATGQVMSREAAVQAAVNQEQANATIKQARATAQGNEEAANAANREASRAAVADANNTTKLRMVALGDAGGAASKALSDSMGAQIAYTKSLEATAVANGYDLRTKEGLMQAQQKMTEEAKKAQAGQDASGKQVDGVTRAAVSLENTIDHVKAGLTAGLLTPLNEKIGPELGRFANNIAAMNSNFAGTGQNTGRAIEGAARGGFERGSGQDPSAPRVANSGGPTGLVLGGSEAAGAVLGGVSRPFNAAIQGLSSQITPRRQGGSMEMTGNMFENWGNGTMVELHGMEGVMRPQDIQKIVESSLSSVKKTLSGGMSGISNRVVNGFDPNINDGGKAHRQGEREFAEKFAAEGNKRNLDKLNADFDRALGITKPVISNSINVPSVPANRNTTPLVNGFDPNINDGGKAHRPGEREFAEKFAAEGNKRNLDKLNADFDRALGITKPAAPAGPAAPALSGGFDISKISKEIVTSISSVSGDSSSTIKGPDMAKLIKPFEKSFAEFDTMFEGMVAKSSEDIADAMGGSKATAAQAKIDEAVAEKQKALDKITFMLNEVSDEDFDQTAWDDAIAERDAAQAKLDKVVEDSIGDLASGFDDLGPAMQEAVSASSPTATQSRGITTDSFTLGPNGLPIAKPKSTAAAVPDKKKEGLTAEEQAKEREDQAKADAARSGITGEKTIKPAPSDSKSATLDDVVKSLNSLNMQMGQLIAVNENGHRSTVKAAKSNSANLYNK